MGLISKDRMINDLEDIEKLATSNFFLHSICFNKWKDQNVIPETFWIVKSEDGIHTILALSY